MRLNLIYLLTLITNFAFGQISSDTITNWQLYKDSVLILSGNEVRQNALLPITTVDTQNKFENLRIDFLYDFYSGDIDRKITFYIDNKQIGEFLNKGSARESIYIPKDFIDRTFEDHLDKQILIRYADNKYNTTGIPIGLIVFFKSNCTTR